MDGHPMDARKRNALFELLRARGWTFWLLRDDPWTGTAQDMLDRVRTRRARVLENRDLTSSADDLEASHQSARDWTD